MYARGLDCCGIWELTDVESAGDIIGEFHEFILEKMCPEGEYNGPAFILFSTTQGSKDGKKLMDYINKEELGVVTKRGPRVNPNTGNRLTVFIWGIDRNNIKRYYKKITK